MRLGITFLSRSATSAYLHPCCIDVGTCHGSSRRRCVSHDSTTPAIERLAEHRAGGLPNLVEARSRTDRAQDELRRKMATLDVDADASVVLFGSWGRRELTEHSDDDWLVLVNGPARELVRPTLEEVGAVLGVGTRKPGKRAIFGVLSWCGDLVDNIGLQDDDNRNLTHRMLLMLESTPSIGAEAYDRAWTRVLDGYLAESRRDRRLPRFFLNDVVRYWRTIAVDFVGKQREDNHKWGLRNAKLRTSRKVVICGRPHPDLALPRSATRSRASVSHRAAFPSRDRPDSRRVFSLDRPPQACVVSAPMTEVDRHARRRNPEAPNCATDRRRALRRPRPTQTCAAWLTTCKLGCSRCSSRRGLHRQFASTRSSDRPLTNPSHLLHRCSATAP